MRRYGLTWHDVRRLEERQGGRCLICGETGPLQVDHCHRSGLVRGLLCSSCNLILGHAKDRPDRLLRAVRYLFGTLEDGHAA